MERESVFGRARGKFRAKPVQLLLPTRQIGERPCASGKTRLVGNVTRIVPLPGDPMMGEDWVKKLDQDMQTFHEWTEPEQVITRCSESANSSFSRSSGKLHPDSDNAPRTAP